MKSEELLRTKSIIDAVDQVVLVINRHNQVVLANTYVRHCLGIAPNGRVLADVFGVHNLYDVIASETFNYHWRGVLSVRLANGEMDNLYVKANFLPDDKCVFNDLLLMGHLVSTHPVAPITEESTHVSQVQLQKLNEISSTINSNLNFQSICEDITMKAAELVGADRSLLYSVEDMKIGVFATWHMTPEERALFRLVDMEHGVIKNCLRNMSPVLVSYYSQHPDWIFEIYDKLQFESFILYPLVAQKQLVGVLALFGTEPMKFDDKHLMLLQMISSQMAIAVLNAQLYSEIRSLNKHLEEEVCLKVNELKVSELQLIRKSNELEAVFNSITDILIVVDKNLRILDVNQATLNCYSYDDRRQIINKKYCDIVCERRQCDECPLDETLKTGKLDVAELAMLGRIYTVTYYPIFDEDGHVLKAICSLRDITLVKRKSSELIQAQKMQAIGQLAAGVAHEIRNPLGAISNYVYILENWLDDLTQQGCPVDGDVRHAFDSIKRLVERSENVIRNLLDFSRDKPSEIVIFAFHDVIEQLIVLVGKTAQHRKVEIKVDGDIHLRVKSDSSALQHILFNLVINAIDALPQGGQILIRYGKSEEGLVITVEDNGIGIKKEEMEKIYNPFYTTKAPNRGTGLGLYLVYNLVKQLNGQITVESEPGRRTIFSVVLPQ